jgi:hypothetical protein
MQWWYAHFKTKHVTVLYCIDAQVERFNDKKAQKRCSKNGVPFSSKIVTYCMPSPLPSYYFELKQHSLIHICCGFIFFFVISNLLEPPFRSFAISRRLSCNKYFLSFVHISTSDNLIKVGDINKSSSQRWQCKTFWSFITAVFSFRITHESIFII